MNYRLTYSKSFKKSLKKMMSSKSFDVVATRELIDQLKSRENLDLKYRDHALKGEFLGCRECHIKNDLLLIYEIDKKIELITLIDIGSHSELFG